MNFGSGTIPRVAQMVTTISFRNFLLATCTGIMDQRKQVNNFFNTYLFTSFGYVSNSPLHAP